MSILEKNIKGYKNIRADKQALSNNSDVVLNVIDNGGGNLAFATASISESGTKTVINSVKTVTIDEIMAENGFDHIDLLKIDIEGAEKELFESNYEKWLPKTKCLIIELHDGFNKAVRRAFSMRSANMILDIP